jgi:ferredoxin
LTENNYQHWGFMSYDITISNTQENFSCHDDMSLLQGMENLGRRGIPVGCRGGGCGVCKVQITNGNYITKQMSRSCISQDDESNHIVLACRCFPTSDITLIVIEADSDTRTT